VSSILFGSILEKNALSSLGTPSSSGVLPHTIDGNTGAVNPSMDGTSPHDSSPKMPLKGSIASNLSESKQIIKKVSLSPM